jgi:hypothetical protein
MSKFARRGIRRRSSVRLAGLPVYEIAYGPDPFGGESRGHAKGIVAVGNVATGWVAVGGHARGGLAVGGTAVGGIAVGGVSAGLIAVGGAAAAALAVGGVAAGLWAVGGVALGLLKAVGGTERQITAGHRRGRPGTSVFKRPLTGVTMPR